jgi:hypothetical protein
MTSTTVRSRTTINAELNAFAAEVSQEVKEGVRSDREGRFALYQAAVAAMIAGGLTCDDHDSEVLLNAIVSPKADAAVWAWEKMDGTSRPSTLSALVTVAVKYRRIDRMKAEAGNKETVGISEERLRTESSPSVRSLFEAEREVAAWDAALYVEDRERDRSASDEDLRNPRSAVAKFAMLAVFYGLPSVCPVGRQGEDKAAVGKLVANYGAGISVGQAAEKAYTDMLRERISFDAWKEMWPQYKHISEADAVSRFGAVRESGKLGSLYETSLSVAKMLTHNEKIEFVLAAEREATKERARQERYLASNLAVRVTEHAAVRARKKMKGTNVEAVRGLWFDGDLSEKDAKTLFPHLWWLSESDFERCLKSMTDAAWTMSLRKASTGNAPKRGITPKEVVRISEAKTERAKRVWRERDAVLDLDRLREICRADRKRRVSQKLSA